MPINKNTVCIFIDFKIRNLAEKREHRGAATAAVITEILENRGQQA